MREEHATRDCAALCNAVGWFSAPRALSFCRPQSPFVVAKDIMLPRFVLMTSSRAAARPPTRPLAKREFNFYIGLSRGTDLAGNVLKDLIILRPRKKLNARPTKHVLCSFLQGLPSIWPNYANCSLFWDEFGFRKDVSALGISFGCTDLSFYLVYSTFSFLPQSNSFPCHKPRFVSFLPPRNSKGITAYPVDSQCTKIFPYLWNYTRFLLLR